MIAVPVSMTARTPSRSMDVWVGHGGASWARGIGKMCAHAQYYTDACARTQACDTMSDMAEEPEGLGAFAALAAGPSGGGAEAGGAAGGAPAGAHRPVRRAARAQRGAGAAAPDAAALRPGGAEPEPGEPSGRRDGTCRPGAAGARSGRSSGRVRSDHRGRPGGAAQGGAGVPAGDRARSSCRTSRRRSGDRSSAPCARCSMPQRGQVGPTAP